MARFRYDRSSKWLLTHHGNQILQLAGIKNVVSWRTVQSEVVQPRQLPDSLIEVFFEKEPSPDLFLVEIATYSDNRVPDQMLDDLMLVYQDRRVLPEIISLVLQPKGNVRVKDQIDKTSRLGLTRLMSSWRVIELWELSAKDALQNTNPGLIPWIPLMKMEGENEEILRECRRILDKQADPKELGSLLAVTEVLGSLRFSKKLLQSIFGGTGGMTEFPMVQEWMAERSRTMIIDLLKYRFGNVPNEIREKLDGIVDEEKLNELNRLASSCDNLQQFQERLSTI